MIRRVRGDGDGSAPRRRVIAAALAGALFALSACRGTPVPVVVPPPPSTTRIARLQQTIDRLLADPALARGTWGVVVSPLDRDEPLYAVNPRKLLMPASTLKVVTLAAAADELGWDFRYRTSVLATGTVDAGVLDGDLVIVGSGDPTIDDWDGAASARFAEWAGLLSQSGIQTIAGRVLGDDTAFDDPGLGAGWAWDDLGASYATRVGALQFNQNTAQIVVTPGRVPGEPPRVDARPEAARLSIRNLATTAPGGTPLFVRPVPRSPLLEVGGSVAPSSNPIVRNVSVANPTLYFVNAARDGLIRNGIAVRGDAEDMDALDVRPDRAAARPVAEIASDRLARIGATMMKMSQNLYAETLLRTVGAKAAGTGSADAGCMAIRGLLARWGVPGSDLLMVDGSGLSRYNLITPEAMVAVLRHVYRDERLRDPFLDALPTAGVDGTLEERMKGTEAAGNARAKTGSFSNARALAGFVRTADGEPLAFAILANNYGTDPGLIDKATDAIVVALAQFSRQ